MPVTAFVEGQTQLDIKPLIGQCQLLLEGQQARHIIRMHRIGPLLDPAHRRMTGEALPAEVGDQAAILHRLPDHRGKGFGEATETVFAFAQRDLALHVFADVEGVPDRPGNATTAFPIGHHLGLQMAGARRGLRAAGIAHRSAVVGVQHHARCFTTPCRQQPWLQLSSDAGRECLRQGRCGGVFPDQLAGMAIGQFDFAIGPHEGDQCRHLVDDRLQQGAAGVRILFGALAVIDPDRQQQAFVGAGRGQAQRNPGGAAVDTAQQRIVRGAIQPGRGLHAIDQDAAQ